MFVLANPTRRGELIRGDRQTFDMTRHHTPALSASRLQLYRECPALYYRRHVLGIYDPPTIDMEYGQAIHAGLQAMFSGKDAELVFLSDLSRRIKPLVEAGADPADWLVPHGIRLLEMVSRLGYKGQPERSFIYVEDGFLVPLRGILDLWMPEQNIVVDWKTTRHAWSEKTPDRYILQRAMYARAAQLECGHHVAFKFGVLGAYPGGFLQIVEATPTQSEIDEALELARDLHRRIEAGLFACSCGKHTTQEAA